MCIRDSNVRVLILMRESYVLGVRGLGAMLIAAAMALAVAACTPGAVNDAIERSSADLLVPGDEWRDSFEFTAPPGSTDLYQLRWNFRAGATDVVTGWQVATTSTFDETRFADGPGTDLVAEAMRAASGDGCTEIEADPRLQLCLYPAEFARGGVNAYLVRAVEGQTLVIDYNNLPGDRTQYNPDALEARFIATDFDSTPLEDTVDQYLVTVF